MAGNIGIVSASAGSGKTYRLAEELERAVVRDGVRPEAVLAVTFTNKAAAELQERVRVRLLDAGKPREAERLGAAFIGTVNSVCGRLVSEFSFDLGVSPETTVLDEERARDELSVSLGDIVAGFGKDLQELGERMGVEDWAATVGRVVELARSNGVDGTALRESAGRSREGALALLGRPEGDAARLDAALEEALRAFLAAVDSSSDTTAMTRTARAAAQKALRRLGQGLELPWTDWLALAGIKPAKALMPAAEEVRRAAAAHDAHPRLREDMGATIAMVFDLASGVLKRYRDRKAELGALDFTDQETMALELLSRKDVRERLRGRIDLVLVDEFQDTSPLQLAVFLRLAGIARRSLWVGDQKQAIYGFRGTDPALMDAAMTGILGGREPETLPTSYRSRTALVTLTSDLFAPAFALQGIPEARVRLAPRMGKEPDGLGPAVERWALESKNLDDDLRALAAGVEDFLSRSPGVRDASTGDVRPAGAGDVAVLCRRNDLCAKTAAALAGLGIRAVLPRGGLMGTPEAWLMLAGLRLWVDGRDTLAAAEIARLTVHAGRESDWFQAAFSGGEGGAFTDVAGAACVRGAAAARPHAGALAAFDAVAEALDARDLCLRWGDASARLSNLEALRAQAVGYAEACRSAGTGCTPAGLVAHFRSIAGAGDARGVPGGGGAVTVSTLHGAKGLEWPVVVLFDPPRTDRFGGALGVHAVTDAPRVSLEDPLAGRWIRYWPYPYVRKSVGAPLHERLAERAETADAARRGDREDLRLLYVGWTRARDTIVLASRAGRFLEGMLQLLQGPGGPLLTEPDGQPVDWAGHRLRVPVRTPAPMEESAPEPVAGDGYEASGPKEYPPAFITPSAVAEGDSPSAGLETTAIGERIPVSGKPEWADLGNAIHCFLCADDAGLPAEERLAMAERVLSAWGVSAAVDARALPRASEALRSWIASRWPGAALHREWPLQHRLPDGSVMRGTCDLAVETPDGYVLVDHKSFPGSAAEAAKRAGTYAGQLALYAAAVTAATGRPVTAAFIHLPVAGLAVKLS